MKNLFMLFTVLLLTNTVIATNSWAAETLTITTEEGQPLAGAEVMIGNAPNDPFANNIFKTDLNGQLSVPSAWTTAQTVTLKAAGYRTASFLALQPITAALQMHREDARAQLEIKGQATQFANLKKDGKVDFAFVFPAMKRRDFVQFDMSSMVSPEVDQMTVITETMDVPSNISIPEQKETYILPITLAKPEYRMYVRRPGNYRMMATHGQFPLKQVVNDFRAGKSFLEVMKHFRFIGGGQKDVSVNSSLTGHDIPVNQIPFDRAIPAQAPTGLADNLAFVTFSMVDQAGLYFPADLKSLSAGDKTELYVPSGSTSNYIVTLTVDKASFDNIMGGGNADKPQLKNLTLQDHVALSIKDAFNSLFGVFGVKFGGPETDASVGGISISVHPESRPVPLVLDLVPPPAQNGLTLTMAAPRAVEGIEPVGTLLVLSEIEKSPKGSRTPDRSYRLWETFQQGWAKEMRLPETATQLDPAKKYEWEVLFLGRATGDNSSDGTYVLDQVTHITRNSLEF